MALLLCSTLNPSERRQCYWTVARWETRRAAAGCRAAEGTAPCVHRRLAVWTRLRAVTTAARRADEKGEDITPVNFGRFGTRASRGRW